MNVKKFFLFSKGTVENGPKHFTTRLFCWQEAAGRRYGLQQTERETPVTHSSAKLRPFGRGDNWMDGHPWPGVRLALVVINHAPLAYLYYKCFVHVLSFSRSQPYFKGFPRVLGFSPGTRVFSGHSGFLRVLGFPPGTRVSSGHSGFLPHQNRIVLY